MKLYCLLQLSPRKVCVIEATDGTTILSGKPVSHCGQAKIVFGPTSDYWLATAELAKLAADKNKVAQGGQ